MGYEPESECFICYAGSGCNMPIHGHCDDYCGENCCFAGDVIHVCRICLSQERFNRATSRLDYKIAIETECDACHYMEKCYTILCCKDHDIEAFFNK